MDKTDINNVSKKYLNINNRVKKALSDFDPEKAKADYEAIRKKGDSEKKITDTLDKIAYAMILGSILLASFWVASLIEAAITSGWKSGERHWVNALYPIAMIYFETGLIYYALPLAAVLAGGGYALLKYSKRRFDDALENVETETADLLKRNGIILVKFCKRCKRQWSKDMNICLTCGGELEMGQAIDMNRGINKTSDDETDSSPKKDGAYCYNCGKKLLKKHKFCPDCGTKVE